MTAEYASGKLQISTVKEFENFELQETVTQMNLELQFNCIGENKVVIFYQDIKAVNNYDPEFSQTSYEIVVPTPLPKNLDVTMFMTVDYLKFNVLITFSTLNIFQGLKISAIDRDLQKFQIKFSLEGSNLFRVEQTLESSVGKTYIAKIITTEQLTRLDESIEFYLTATVR